MHRLRLQLVWAVQPDPTRAVTNAWKFIEIVRGVEPNGPDLGAVRDWFDGEADPTPEGLISADSDAVTITTVHSAKGLEWRVVVLAGLEQGLASCRAVTCGTDRAQDCVTEQARWHPVCADGLVRCGPESGAGSAAEGSQRREGQ